MPIFEFKCLQCGHLFEALVFSSERCPSECPSCKGEDLQRTMSAHAVGRSVGGSRGNAGNCSSCSSSGCPSAGQCPYSFD